MKRIIPALAIVGLLSACSGDGTNPFDDPVLDENDPSTLNSKFLFDVEDQLTMNSVEYDETNDELVINNLPFDGPDGRYDRWRTQEGVGIYRSRQTATTGQIRHYAVFMRNDDMEVAAAAGADWIGFGYGGANVQRNSYNLPGGVGEYIYLGTYGGVRTRNDGSGLQIVTGDVELLLDIRDFDENGDGEGDGILEGAVVGVIRDRNRTDAATGAVITNDLPTVSLAVVQYDPETGTFSDGVASTGFEGNIRDEGTWEGLIGGSTGGSIGAYVNIVGPAEIQTVRYEVVTWEDPATGATGIVSGYDSETDFDTIFSLVNSGTEVGFLDADRSGIPAGATLDIEIEEIVFETESDARETGVILTTQVPTP